MPVGIGSTDEYFNFNRAKASLRSVWTVLFTQRHVDVVRTSHVSESWTGLAKVYDRDDFPGGDVLPKLFVDHREVFESRNERNIGVDRAFDREELGSSTAAGRAVLVVVVLSVERDPVDDRVEDLGGYVIERPLGRRKSTSGIVGIVPMWPDVADFEPILPVILNMLFEPDDEFQGGGALADVVSRLREPLPRMAGL